MDGKMNCVECVEKEARESHTQRVRSDSERENVCTCTVLYCTVRNSGYVLLLINTPAATIHDHHPPHPSTYTAHSPLLFLYIQSQPLD
jgi:hypothetical protein